jgi:hypothetical protein
VECLIWLDPLPSEHCLMPSVCNTTDGCTIGKGTFLLLTGSNNVTGDGNGMLEYSILFFFAV